MYVRIWLDGFGSKHFDVLDGFDDEPARYKQIDPIAAIEQEIVCNELAAATSTSET